MKRIRGEGGEEEGTLPHNFMANAFTWRNVQKKLPNAHTRECTSTTPSSGIIEKKQKIATNLPAQLSITHHISPARARVRAPVRALVALVIE